MTEVPQIPWDAVLSNFLWILGASIILATFSYHEYLVHLQKIKRKEILRKVSFKRPSVLGMTLIAAGISLSLSIPWLSAISGSVAFLFTIWFFKLIKKLPMKKIKRFIKTYFLITGIGANIYILWILLGLPFCFDRLLIESECPVRGEFIVCLGGGISANSLPTDEGWQCIYTAVQLYFDGYGKKIIFTGGGTEKITEAEVYAEAAQWLGCPEEALAFDPTPSSTAEHALNMLELKIPKVTKEDTLNIVTSPLHTRRTAMCFKKKGFMRLRMVTSYSSKREDPKIVRNLRTSKFAAYHPSGKSYGDMFNRLKWRSSYFFAALREVVAIVWYWVKGYV